MDANHVKTFSILGAFLRQFSNKEKDPKLDLLNEQCFDSFQNAIEKVHVFNPWFIKEFVVNAIHSLGCILKEEELAAWISKYSCQNSSPSRIAVILAGNIPLVGFHDMICVLLSGNIFIGKLSSKDDILIKEIKNVLEKIDPSMAERIILTGNTVKEFDAIIATGSNNSARYFEYYFGKYPSVIRKNRNSIAILDGCETREELEKLADDIFMYFGLGCRNVSKLFVPRDYDFKTLIECSEKYKFISNHNKYANNYDYNRTVYLMNMKKFLDTGFFILKEDSTISSPISVVYYEYYDNMKDIDKVLEQEKYSLQCVVSRKKYRENMILPGETQQPTLNDYADGIDTMNFLSSLETRHI